MNTKSVEVRARVEPNIKKKALGIFSKMGITESEAIRLFLKSVILYNGLPFNFKIPNKETLDAIKEAKEGKLSDPVQTIDQLFQELEA